MFISFILSLYSSFQIAYSSSLNGELRWDYFGKGPDLWFTLYDQCDGVEQSPIDIITDDIVYDSNLPKMKFFNYEKLIYWNVTRNNNSGDKYKFLKIFILISNVST